MAGIYLHIPFCKQACYYCDFHFSTNNEVREQMISAMISEISIRKDFLQREPIRTIYFGGGTPSLLDAAEIERLVAAIAKTHGIESGAEITLEANPDDLTKNKLTALLNTGINRLSIGIQSFDNKLLRQLHRVHDAETALHSVVMARETGFTNISLDLIYAIPGLTESGWMDQLDQALALKPEHLSCYALTIEEKTVFGKWMASGRFIQVEEELAARQLEITAERLQPERYEHYEVSNFAQPGYRSRHNTSYWKQEKYLGIGPSAHSYDGHIRTFNVSNNSIYIREILSGKVPAESEVLTVQNKINEYLLTTLRTSWGSDLLKLKREYEVDLLQTNAAYIHELVNEGLASLNDNVLTLSSRGKLFADKIASDLFVVDL
jgi:oxygen-independent coproporphyrinogen-3 oxidase